ncbi:hypothetical protein [Elioraea sp.]|uniref:hypothetical protein n=1 Tax=Elioraea sp. TaxID=2185103 RepID=UPI003F6FB4F9
MNFESDTAPKMVHRFHRIDAQPLITKTCQFPDGVSRFDAEEQVKRMWFSWTRFHKDADTFIKRFVKGSTDGTVSDLLTDAES